jgi:hypothetical protein
VPVLAVVPKEPGFTRILHRAWEGFLTAVTSSAAVKAEKNLAVTVITGVLLSLGASVGLIDLITKIIQGLS